MKNEYNKKKRITIITLSALAVCLAVGLFWYMGTLGNTQPPAAQTESQPEPEPSVTVPEIKPESTTVPSTSTPETKMCIRDSGKCGIGIPLCGSLSAGCSHYCPVVCDRWDCGLFQ